jgi:aquaporin Z
MRARLLAEFVGAFLVVLTAGLAGAQGPDAVPWATAAILVATVAAGGRISGGHYNPAVTLGAWLRGDLRGAEAAAYAATQTLAALAASAGVWGVHGEPMRAAPAEEASLFAFFLLEMVFGFALVLTYLHAGSITRANGSLATAVGAVALAGLLAAGPLTAGAFNPALAVGALALDALAGDGATRVGWVYVAAPVCGAGLAALVRRAQTVAPATDPPAISDRADAS